MKELPDRLARALVNPKCVGTHAEPDGSGRATNEACGDVLELTLVLRGEAVELRFRAQACAAVIAVAAYACEALDGRPVDDVRAFDLGRAIESLGGLPRHRQHAVRVFGRALDQALAESKA